MKPIFWATLIQLVAAGLAFAVVDQLSLAPYFWLPLQLITAVSLAMLVGQPRWWWLIHALFGPAIGFFLWLALPAWLYLLAFVLAWLVFGRVDRNRVPLYLSNRRAIAALEPLLPQGGRILDIGAGTATVLIGLKSRPDLQLHGIEHAWLPWLLGLIRLRWHGVPARWLRGDMMAHDLSGYDVVYAFLSPAAMPLLWEKARREMRSGSLLVSNSFAVPTVAADQIIELNDWKGAKLHLWRMP